MTLELTEYLSRAQKDGYVSFSEKNGKIQINTINIRDFSEDKHNHVDDYPYGGGNGMVIKPDVVFRAYNSIVERLEYKPKTIYLTPKGKTLNNVIAKDISNEEHLILLCGHYEGIDQRVLDEIVDEEISIGDYVLTGGEVPSMVITDAITRLIPGVITSESLDSESFNDGMLDYPNYTRPEVFRGMRVPEVLLTGHHKNIEKWRNDESIRITKERIK
mgnify:CR=1 FL=1